MVRPITSWPRRIDWGANPSFCGRVADRAREKTTKNAKGAETRDVDNTFLCTVATLQYWRLWRFGGSISSASWDLHPPQLGANPTLHSKGGADVSMRRE
jgi:hypothetical protein